MGLLLSGLLGLATPDTGQDFGVFDGVASSLGGFLLSVVLAPVIGAIFLLIVAGICHLLTLLFVGAQNSGGFEATTRVVSYSWVYHFVSWIPVVGSLIGLVAFALLAVPGIREVHGTTTQKAALVV